MADPATNRNAPRSSAQDLPPGRTALVSMFPLRLDEPTQPNRSTVRPTQAAAASQASLNGGK